MLQKELHRPARSRAMNVFTYGSLMFPEIWLRVAGRAFPTQKAHLADFAAYQVRGEVYPGLAACPGAITSGVVYLGVDEAALARLDHFEGAYYERRALEVRADDGSVIPVHAYVVAEAYRETLDEALWDAEVFRTHHLTSFLGPRAVE